jgi:menaquinone-dependent protoporphyrinogen oxidase
MRTLISTASRHGSTTEVAARGAGTMRAGLPGDVVVDELAAAEIGDLVRSTRARGRQVFAGRLDRHRLGFGEKAVVVALRVADGDFRDVDAIDAWGAQIAADLSRARPGKP